MENELLSLIKTIKEKTGVEVFAYTENMRLFLSAAEGAEPLIPTKADFSEVFSDAERGATFFRFRFKGVWMIGYILGAGEVEKNYAYFILSFLESGSVREAELKKGEYLKGVLAGDFTRQQIQRFMRRFAVPEAPCYVLAISGGRANEVLNFLEEYNLNGVDSAALMDETSCAFVKFMSDGGDENQSPAEFASILAETLLEETGMEVRIGVGGVVQSLLNANASYAEANGALKMSASFGSKSNVHSYKEFVWIKILEELPKFKQMEYLEILADGDARAVWEDEDMLATVEEFFGCDLNISETSRRLFMHRNTLMYRLDKIERLTGLDIKRFSDAVTFRLITVLNKLIGKR